MPTSKISLRSLLEVCGNLGVCAGDILREVHESRLSGGKEGLKLVDKGAASGKGFDPQTIADRRSERLIVAELRERFGPELCIVGEETGLAPKMKREEEAEQDDDEHGGFGEETVRYESRVTLQPWWPIDEPEDLVDLDTVSIWIDPLDATREFTEGKVEFCTVLIGIAIGGRSTAGVMVEPFSPAGDGPICWWGMKGKGCHRTTVSSGESVPIVFPHPSHDKRKVRIAISRSRQGGLVHQFVSQYTSILESSKIDFSISFSGGCGHKILEVLKGNSDFYPFPCSGTSLWDSCAGDALLDSAGGLLLDKRGLRLVFDPTLASFENVNGLLAANDGSICRFASDSITACLEYSRNLNYEFFLTNDFLQKALQVDKVLHFETPKTSLKRNKRIGSVEFDIVAKTSTEGTRVLRFRRFDPTNFFFDNDPSDDFFDDELVLYLCTRASEGHLLAHLVGQSSSHGFSEQIIHLERCAHRRPATTKEVLLRAKEKKGYSKTFLQSLAFVVLHETGPVERCEDAGLRQRVTFVKRMHDNDPISRLLKDQGWEAVDLYRFSMYEAAFSSSNKRHKATDQQANLSDAEEESKRQAVSERIRRVLLAAEGSHTEQSTEVREKPQRPIAMRGMYRTSTRACLLDDVRFCAAATDTVENRLQDLCHLFIVEGHTARDVRLILSEYFGGASNEIARKFKTQFLRYASTLIPSKLFSDIVEQAKERQRILAICEVLCQQMEQVGSSGSVGSDLDAFNVTLSSSKI